MCSGCLINFERLPQVSGDNSSESGSEPCSLTTSGQLNYNGTEQGQGVAESRREGNRHQDESTDTEDDGDELEMDSKAILEIFASLDWSEEVRGIRLWFQYFFH
jgi:hypothetical protein